MKSNVWITFNYISIALWSFCIGSCMNMRSDMKQETQKDVIFCDLFDVREVYLGDVNNNSNNNYIGVFKMSRNMRFCRTTEDGAKIEYAPVILPPKTSAPTEEEYNEAGWFRNGILPPVVPEGKVVSKTTYRYDEEENAIVADYEFEDAPKPIRVFSKLKLFGALTQAGLWDSFEAWLKTQTINGMNAYTAFSLAQDLNDENPMFLTVVAAAQQALGVPEEVVEQILEASILE